jgi:hypothetical protein
MRFQYGLNVVIPGALAALHLLNPTLASQQLWQGARAALPIQMLGAWWAAVALLSVLGLRSPYKYR